MVPLLGRTPGGQTVSRDGSKVVSKSAKSPKGFR
jgi:hypothetical protein